ncbi:hypothetical protein KEM52_001717, partial [Ascosphaera acerosa]
RRREQVRAAQQAYRLRKEKAITDLTVRVAHLEKTITSVTKSFHEFLSSVHNAGVLQAHPELAMRLQKTHEQMRMLTADANIEWPALKPRQLESQGDAPRDHDGSAQVDVGAANAEAGSGFDERRVPFAAPCYPVLSSSPAFDLLRLEQQQQQQQKKKTAQQHTSRLADEEDGTDEEGLPDGLSQAQQRPPLTPTSPGTESATYVSAPAVNAPTAIGAAGFAGIGIGFASNPQFLRHPSSAAAAAGQMLHAPFFRPGEQFSFTIPSTLQFPRDFLFASNNISLVPRGSSLLSAFSTRIFRTCLEKAIMILRDEKTPSNILHSVFGPIFSNVTKQQLLRLFVNRLHTGSVAVLPVNIDAPLVRNWTATDWAMALGLQGRWLFIHEVEQYLSQRGVSITGDSGYAWIDPEVLCLGDQIRLQMAQLAASRDDMLPQQRHSQTHPQAHPLGGAVVEPVAPPGLGSPATAPPSAQAQGVSVNMPVPVVDGTAQYSPPTVPVQPTSAFMDAFSAAAAAAAAAQQQETLRGQAEAAQDLWESMAEPVPGPVPVPVQVQVQVQAQTQGPDLNTASRLDQERLQTVHAQAQAQVQAASASDWWKPRDMPTATSLNRTLVLDITTFISGEFTRRLACLALRHACGHGYDC